jgi:hypothetical protein
VWWSRFALPRLQAWQSQKHPVRLVEHSWHKGDPDPKALACYGVLWQKGSPEDPDRSEIWLRFVTGRKVERDHDRVPGVLLSALGSPRKTEVAADLGQCVRLFAYRGVA